jgi:tetratricopeptide (TPR) repeat protein
MVWEYLMFVLDVRLEKLMMMRVRVLTSVIAISILIFSACTSDESAERMPVTTDSELALKLYETGMVAHDEFKGSIAWGSLKDAVGEDPDFFMAYFWMYFMFSKDSKGVAEEAFQSDTELSDGEEQLKTALKYFVDGQDEKVIETLRKLVDLYPSDPYTHKILYYIQYHYHKDIEGAIESLEDAIEAFPEFSYAYNLLGYAFMDLEQYDKAEEALDAYITLAPGLANPYDSKGDFYMKTEQYLKAYDSYLKSYEIDPINSETSKKKALKAKQMMEKVSI